MPAYVVVNVEVQNPVGYEDYKGLVEPSIKAYGGRYLVRGGQVEVVEGDWVPNRFVIVEFPDAARAKAWWESAEYAEAKAIRQACARTDMFIVEGL
ncbi:MAG TPA: DUF1330 domain-containing protein [Blastocatellia bacterium]|nr:DUF1330 domain-containing protein [Blastocatellia bacterium]